MTDRADSAARDNDKKLMAKALEEIKRLREENRRLQDDQQESIAVIGVGCRLPGNSNDIDQFWHLLTEGREGLGETPPDRWDSNLFVSDDPTLSGKITSKRGGFISEGLEFDAGFFGIAPVEARSLDPQQALLLEVVWQALEHGNITPKRLYNSNTGVFIGASSPDNSLGLMGGSLDEVDGYHGSGCAFGPLAGRVSYFYGLLGPSFVVDTACSSSLVSLHLAADSLRRKECDLAIAGGVQINAHPGFSVTFSQAKMLSPDGRCRTFDKDANGYVRGEGCGVFILKRLRDAEEDHDKIVAVMRGSAVNQDGPSGGLTVPSGPAQVRVIREALRRSKLQPSDVSFVEAHGTGTSLGDPIEVGALGEVFGARDKKRPLVIGSLKTNIGHLEAAAGIAGAIKTVLALKNRQVPQHLNLENANPLIAWDELPIEVASGRGRPLPNDKEVHAGVSSFGFSGTNAHIVFSSYEPQETPGQRTPKETISEPTVLMLSARTKSALVALSQRYEELFSKSKIEPHSLAASILDCRAEHLYRIAVLGATREQLIDRLHIIARGDSHPAVLQHKSRALPAKIGFAFSGQGSQYVGMGSGLYQQSVTFRDAFDRCASLIENQSGKKIVDLITSKDEEINRTENAQIAIFTVQYALCQLWKARGIEPAFVIGHSVGEVAAALCAGVMGLEDAVRLIVSRADLMGKVTAPGGMVAVSMGESEVKQLLTAPEEVIAAVNGPNSTVISAPPDRISSLLGRFAEKDVQFKELNVSHAFHSRDFVEAADRLQENIKAIDFQSPQIPMSLNLTGALFDSDQFDSNYWSQQMLSPVRFFDGMKSIDNQSIGSWVEIGGHPTLLPMMKEILDESVNETEGSHPHRWIASLHRSSPDSDTFLKACGRLWVCGHPIKLSPEANRQVDLPTYPFERKNYRRRPLVARPNHPQPDDRLDAWTLHVRSKALTAEIFQRQISINDFPELDDHHVFGDRVVSGAFFLAMLTEAFLEISGAEKFEIKQLEFPQALSLSGDRSRWLQLEVSQDVSKGTFELSSSISSGDRERVHAHGQLRITPDSSRDAGVNPIDGLGVERLPPEEIYTAQHGRQIDAGPSYHWVSSCRIGTRLGHVDLSRPVVSNPGFNWRLPPGLVDSCFGVFVYVAGVPEFETYVPVGIDLIQYFEFDPSIECFARVEIHDLDFDRGQINGSIEILDAENQTLLRLQGVRAKRVTRDFLLDESMVDGEDFLTLDWRPTELNSENRDPGAWLFLGQEDQLCSSIIKALESKGQVVVRGLSGLSEGDRSTVEDEFAHLQNILSTEKPVAADGWRGIIDCRLISNLANTDLSQEDLWSVCGPSFTALKSLIKHPHSLSYVVVTTGAVQASEYDFVSRPLQAMTWGLIRSALRELPEFPIKVIDAESRGISESADLIVRVALSVGRESQFVIREKSLHIPRLIKTDRDRGDGLQITASHAYVLIGGHGGIGGTIVRWLVNCGVKYIVIVGRRHTNSSEALDFLKEQKKNGVSFCVINFPENGRYDVADLELDSLDRPVGAIFHLAGTTADKSLKAMSWNEFSGLFASKVQIADGLRRYSDAHPEVQIIFFSSFVSVAGSEGQANYASVNAYLDAVASMGRANITSLGWGPWNGVGMAGRLEKSQLQNLQTQGVELISPARAMSVFNDIELLKGGHQIIAPVNWQRWISRDPIFSDLIAEPGNRSSDDHFLKIIRKRSVKQRKTLMSDHLRALVSSILLLDAGEINVNDRLFDIGVDSLIAMQLKSKLQQDLGVPLGSTLLFDFPTVDRLAHYLVEEFVNPLDETGRDSQRSSKDAPSQNEVDALASALHRLKESLS